MSRHYVKAVNDYGLDAELAAKANAKYDPELENQAKSWISSMTGASFARGFAATLHDGSVLCDLVNKVRPNSVRSVYRGDMPFRQMENVSGFISAARRLGVAESDLFTTVALYEEKDMGQVVTCILALKRVASNSGRADAGAQRTSRRLLPRSGDGEVSKLSLGSYGVMDTKKEVVTQFNRGSFGRPTNPDASVSKLNNGSFGVMESTANRHPMTETNRAEYARATQSRRASGPQIVDRGPNSAYGVMREMPWEKPADSRSPVVTARAEFKESTPQRSWREDLEERAARPAQVPVNASRPPNEYVPPRPAGARDDDSSQNSGRRSMGAWLWSKVPRSGWRRSGSGGSGRASVRAIARAFEQKSRDAKRDSRWR